MRHIYWVRSRQGRLLVILLAVLVYFCLLALDALNLFPPDYVANDGSSWLAWTQFGFSAFVSLMLLAVGVLVWLYARNRRVAILLFLFCLSMMVAIELITASSQDKPPPLLLYSIGTIAGALAIYSFALLVLVFPKNHLSSVFSSYKAGVEGSSQSARQERYILLLRGYLAALTLLAFASVLYYVLSPYIISNIAIITLSNLENVFVVLALSGGLAAIIITYRQSSSRRERQQLLLFVGGVILAIAPFLFLTVIPDMLEGVFPFAVDPQISTLTLALLPLVLGYSILRYQFLVFDRHIRVAVAWIVGVVGLVVLAYIVVTVSSLLFASNLLASTILAVVLMGLLAPWTWWYARTVSEKIFFSEIRHFRRQLDLSTDMLAGETLDLNAAARLLTLAVIDAFATQEVCLYVLDEDTGNYRLLPLLKEHEPGDIVRRSLARRLYHVNNEEQYNNAEALSADATIIQRMHSATRPLSLSEASEEALPTGLARYLATVSAPFSGLEPILAPVRVQGKLIAVLALGERGDGQQYAGPDFEALSLLFARFSPLLETARLYERANRHTAILNTLYGAGTLDLSSLSSVDEVASAYCKIAAEAVMAGAAVWLYGKDNRLRCVTLQGTGPQLACEDNLLLAHIQDWTPRFCEGESVHPREHKEARGPAQTEQLPCFPYAWLPLQKGQQKIGILVLTYSRPHLFSHEEKRVLEMFAVQCADALENTRMTIALRAAYARQQELDQLKDQFIATASHELRTPLTAVQGYIELLAAYDEDLAPEARADFIAKANRGCDELNLMVGNIMDASHVQIDAENVQLSQLSLPESVRHVLEILEAITQHEKRVIAVDIPADMCVMADQMRLRRVLLNLVSNALKYSPPGSPIEISADGDDRQTTLRVRDYGAGVPLEDQERLFERFVRLERDINSTVRGAGLGLYISKQLIEAMHGQIGLVSSGVSHEGSTFFFTMRRSPTAQDAASSGGRQHAL